MRRLVVPLLLALISAPTAAGDVTIDSPAVKLTLLTGVNEDCFPNEQACVVAQSSPSVAPADPGQRFEAPLTLGARARVPIPLPGGAVLEYELSRNDSEIRHPLFDVYEEAYRRMYPEEFREYFVFEPQGKGFHIEAYYVNPRLSTMPPTITVDRLNTTPHLSFANRSSIFLPAQIKPTESTDDAPSAVEDFWLCERPLLGGATTATCPLDTVGDDVAAAWRALTPEVVFGATFTYAAASVGGDITLRRASPLTPDEPAPARLSGSTAHAQLAAPVAAFGSGEPIGSRDVGDRREPAAPAPPRVPASSASATSSAVAPASPGMALVGVLAAATASAVLTALLALLFRGRLRGEGVAKLLEDPTRRRIMEAVDARPGLTLSDAARAVGIAHTPARYHVRILQRAGLVVVARRAGPRAFCHLYTPTAAPPREARAVALELRSPAARAVARALLDETSRGRGLGVAELAERSRQPVTTVRFHLARLREHGDVVAVAREVGGLRFAPSEEGSRRLARALAAPSAVAA